LWRSRLFLLTKWPFIIFLAAGNYPIVSDFSCALGSSCLFLWNGRANHEKGEYFYLHAQVSSIGLLHYPFSEFFLFFGPDNYLLLAKVTLSDSAIVYSCHKIFPG
jgi:hypothetical protein